MRTIKRRVTDLMIERLLPGEVFVFGSNLQGKHIGGAAYKAYKEFGAEMGVANGISGNTYAIPTVNFNGKITLDEIRAFVNQFVNHVKNSRANQEDRTFLVTPIGCGIAGFKVEEIAPLFEECISLENLKLPLSFWNYYEGTV